MELNKILTARSVISKCAGEKLPPQIAYKFAKFLKATDTEEEFFNNKLKGILDQYAEKDTSGDFVKSDGNGVLIQPDKIEVCQTEISQLEKTEIEISFSFSLTDFEGLKLSITDIFNLDELIKGE
jgi:hypothetical protein